MAQLKYNVQVRKNLVPAVRKEVAKTVKQSIRTIAQDISRTASETAPHKTGDLSASYAMSFTYGDKVIGTVEFTAYKGGFNYAIAMHEWTYNLGEGSRKKGGGTGMSGATYPVGNKFLTRVLEGESKAYADYIQKKVREVTRRR